jgi:hypothetical protein
MPEGIPASARAGTEGRRSIASTPDGVRACRPPSAHAGPIAGRALAPDRQVCAGPPRGTLGTMLLLLVVVVVIAAAEGLRVIAPGRD